MTKLRKQRKRKVYRHNVNRKRMRNKMFSVGKIKWYVEWNNIYIFFTTAIAS